MNNLQLVETQSISDEMIFNRTKIICSASNEFNMNTATHIKKKLEESGVYVGSEEIIKRCLELLWDDFINGNRLVKKSAINNVLLSPITENEVRYLSEMVLFIWQPKLNRPVTNLNKRPANVNG